MKCHQSKPINAEAPSSLLADHWITPTELFFVRNHHPIPVVNADAFALTVSVGGKTLRTYTVDELKSLFRKSIVISSIQCGGNRRSEMNEVILCTCSSSSSC